MTLEEERSALCLETETGAIAMCEKLKRKKKKRPNAERGGNKK